MQTPNIQQGIFFKTGTATRLSGVLVKNKRTGTKDISNIYGTFSIRAEAGDTLLCSISNYRDENFVVTKPEAAVVYLQPVIQLNEVVVKENSLAADIKEVQKGYREKSVFYTGTPHYYYLVLKPMTFIYENFKSEVKDARRFNRYAKQELTSAKIAERFNDAFIKKTIALDNDELEVFKSAYTPTLAALNSMDDYELIIYTRKSFASFRKRNTK